MRNCLGSTCWLEGAAGVVGGAMAGMCTSRIPFVGWYVGGITSGEACKWLSYGSARAEVG